MKKTICVIIALILTVSLTACGWNATERDTENNDNRMAIIFNDGFVKIYVDNETGVQYLVGSSRGVCVMVDESGHPLINQPTE